MNEYFRRNIILMPVYLTFVSTYALVYILHISKVQDEHINTVCIHWLN